MYSSDLAPSLARNVLTHLMSLLYLRAIAFLAGTLIDALERERTDRRQPADR